MQQVGLLRIYFNGKPENCTIKVLKAQGNRKVREVVKSAERINFVIILYLLVGLLGLIYHHDLLSTFHTNPITFTQFGQYNSPYSNISRQQK